MKIKENSFLFIIINFFKGIFRTRNKNLLVEQNQDALSNKNTEKEIFEKNISIQRKDEKDSSDKNITMFLYKQVRLGNLEPKYIPDEYLEKINTLLKEEKKIKQNKINTMNHEIQKNEKIINQYNKK